jgi:hypothetical protein
MLNYPKTTRFVDAARSAELADTERRGRLFWLRNGSPHHRPNESSERSDEPLGGLGRSHQGALRDTSDR